MLKLTIEKVLNNAYGLSHLDSGKAVMIPYTVTGDEIQAEIEKETSSYCIAKLQNIIKPSSFRVQPNCKYYTICGGCDMLHISREYELFLKQSWIKNDAERAFKDSKFTLNDIVYARDTEYRYKVRYSQDGDAKGFKKRGSTEVVNIDSCPLVSKQTILDSVTVGGKTFHLSPSVFFQNNLEIAKKIAYFILENIVGNVVYDFYAGVGFFSSFIEDKYIVTAVEGNPECKKYAHQNLKFAHYIESGIEDVHKYLKKKADTIIVDPPRSGMSKKAIKNLLSYKSERVIYISCSYINAIRDIKEMTGYKIESITPFDMFPKTHHVETVVLMSRVNTLDK